LRDKHQSNAQRSRCPSKDVDGGDFTVATWDRHARLLLAVAAKRRG